MKKLLINRAILALFFLLLFSGIYLTMMIINIFEKVEKENLLIQANLIANSIDTALLKNLHGIKSDVNSSSYIKINQQLRHIRLSHKICKFLYILGINEKNEYFFYVDSQIIGAEDYAHPGLIYTEISQEYKDAIENDANQIVGPVTDRWGTVVTALIPVKDPLTDKTIATLGMDQEVNQWNNTIIVKSLLAIAMISMIIILTLILVIIHKKNSQLQITQGHLRKEKKKTEEANKKLQSLSITDELTQLYNRRKIDQLLTQEINRSARHGIGLGIILVDIDLFKSVNDTYGHQVGDSVLIEFSQIIKSNIRESDFVGRWGGEEFVIICTDINSKGILTLAEKIRKKVEEYSFKSIENSTASFGIAFYVQGDSIDELFQKVDSALYKAKDKGRNAVVLYT